MVEGAGVNKEELLCELQGRIAEAGHKPYVRDLGPALHCANCGMDVMVGGEVVQEERHLDIPCMGNICEHPDEVRAIFNNSEGDEMEYCNLCNNFVQDGELYRGEVTDIGEDE